MTGWKLCEVLDAVRCGDAEWALTRRVDLVSECVDTGLLVVSGTGLGLTHAAHRALYEQATKKTCPNCGERFTPPLDKQYYVYCSWDCLLEHGVNTSAIRSVEL